MEVIINVSTVFTVHLIHNQWVTIVTRLGIKSLSELIIHYSSNVLQW